MRRLGFLFGPAVVSLLALACFAQAAKADIAFSCLADSSNCHGNGYAVWLVNQTGNTYVLQYDILVTADYTGQPTDVVHAVALKDFAPSFTNFSLLKAPDGVNNWNLVSGELNAKGCAVHTDPALFRLCVEAKAPSYPGAALSQLGVLSWQFQFDSALGLNDTAHIKYLYEDVTGKKVGSLGSWDIPIQQVPEPASVLGLGTLLLLLGSRLKRKKS